MLYDDATVYILFVPESISDDLIVRFFIDYAALYNSFEMSRGPDMERSHLNVRTHTHPARPPPPSPISRFSLADGPPSRALTDPGSGRRTTF